MAGISPPNHQHSFNILRQVSIHLFFLLHPFLFFVGQKQNAQNDRKGQNTANIKYSAQKYPYKITQKNFITHGATFQ